MAKWTWNGAEFDAKRLTVRDELNITHLASRLQDASEAKNNQEWYYCNTFARFAASSTLVNGDPGLPMVSFETDDATLVAAMNAWLDESGWLAPWEEAFKLANSSPNGKALQPGTEKNASAPSKGKGGASS